MLLHNGGILSKRGRSVYYKDANSLLQCFLFDPPGKSNIALHPILQRLQWIGTVFHHVFRPCSTPIMVQLKLFSRNDHDRSLWLPKDRRLTFRVAYSTFSIT